MTISFAGIADSDVSASATGLSKVGGGRYNMSPGGGETIINVTGTLQMVIKFQTEKHLELKNSRSNWYY
jgi:hypothetical protein